MRKVKLYVFSFCICILLSINMVHSQKISGTFENKSLTFVLNSISLKYNLKIAFDTKVADQVAINSSFKRENLDAVLQQLCEKSELKFQKMGDVYLIIPNPTPKETVSDINPQPVKIKYFIKGFIKDKTNGESLPFATIMLAGTQLGTTTNMEGYFNIDCNNSDSLLFVINYLGYKPKAVKASPSATPDTYFLEPDIVELSSIVVTDKLEVYDQSLVNAGKVKFNPSKLVNIPALAELDITAPIQLLSGIEASRENAGGFIIRKSAPDKTLIIYDGFTLYHNSHFFGAFSSINTKAVKDIQVYKGGYDARYGGSASGIIEITGKSGNSYKPVLDVGMDMLAIDGKVELPVIKEKVTLLVSGRRSITDVVQTPLYRAMFDNAKYDFSEYYRKPPKAFTSSEGDPNYYFNDYNSKITYVLSKKTTISASAFGSADNLDFNQPEEYPKIFENTKWSSKGFSFRCASQLTTSWSSAIVIGQSITNFNYSVNDSSLKTRKRLARTFIDTISQKTLIASELKNKSFNWDNIFQFNQHHLLEWGVNSTLLNADYNLTDLRKYNQFDIIDSARVYKANSKLNALWLQYTFTKNRLQVKPGVRWSYYSKTGKRYPELRFSSLYNIRNDLVLKGSWGKYYQFVNKINFVKKGDYRSAWLISDDDKIPVVSSKFGMLGFTYNISSTLNLDVEAYSKEMDGLTSSEQRLNRLNKIAGFSWKYSSNAKGIDVMLKKNLSIYQLWIAYSYSTTKDQSKKINNGESYWDDNDQRHELKIFNLLKINNWCLTANGIYGSGIPWDTYDLDDDLKIDPNYVRNNQRLPSYFRVDAGLNYSIKFSKAELKAGCNLYNIFNNTNVIDRFDKLSDTPLSDIREGLDPLQSTEVRGLGFAYNLFFNIIF